MVTFPNVHFGSVVERGDLGNRAVVPSRSTRDDPDDALGDEFVAALLDLLDVLAERGDRLDLDQDASLGAVAATIKRWLAVRWAQTPPHARPTLVVEAVRVALASRANGH